MKTLNLAQGSPEWAAHRANAFNASEAAAVMGAHKYLSRSALLEQMATGIRPEVKPQQQALFDRGHRAEAAARPLIEELIGEELFPCVGCWDQDDRFSASFDGLTLLGEIAFECKLWNADLAAAVEAGELPAHYYWQLEHQLLVSGAEKVIFATASEDASTMRVMEYRPVAGRREQLIAGWLQFAADLAAYQPATPAVEVVGRAPETLPALRIEVTGAVTASNLAEFKATALAVINAVNDDLQTDEDFADAEKAVKWCGDVEKRLAAAKEAALAQTADIDALFKAIDDIAAEARTKRLNLTKKVEARKVSIRAEIQQTAQAALAEHLAFLSIKASAGACNVKISVPADFATAMKGKKTVASLRDAADAELARAKVDANLLAERVAENQRIVDELAAGHLELFADRATLVLKHADDLTAAIHARIAQHQARMAAEAERIERETRLKLEREQQAREAAEEASRAAAARAAQQLAAHQAKVERAAEDFGGTEKVIVTESAPAPAAIAEVPAPVVTTKAAPQAEIPRPSDEDLIFAVAHSFAVPTSVAAGWLRTMNQAVLAKAAA